MIAVDRFGNLITNVRTADLDALGPRAALQVALGRRPLGALETTYAAVARGRVVCLIGSAGELEIAVRDGTAARRLRARIGARVSVRAAPTPSFRQPRTSAS
ncbi:MAG: SAM-dependent chlorinase/fluorinase [Planctomycetes bacterium]|nr:SAM-dependent chlorinase/fluorinase [Planctomycetota bacterium]